MMGRHIGPGRLLLLFGALSLAAVTLGVVVSLAHGVPASAWLKNLAAWGVGALAGGLIAARAGPGAPALAVCAAPVGLALTFLSPDLDSVHRWIDLGPAHLNAAMLLLPAAIVGLATLAPQRRWPWLAVLAALGGLVAQPDASQAAALAAPIILVAAVSIHQPFTRLTLIVATIGLAAVTWLRPDPLAPVAEVEGIVGLAFALSPLLGGLAMILLVFIAATPVVGRGAGLLPPRLAGAALGLCFLAWTVTPFLGAFPVPLIGMGMSPIIGSWLGVGLLANLMRRDDD